MDTDADGSFYAGFDKDEYERTQHVLPNAIHSQPNTIRGMSHSESTVIGIPMA